MTITPEATVHRIRSSAARLEEIVRELVGLAESVMWECPRATRFRENLLAPLVSQGAQVNDELCAAADRALHAIRVGGGVHAGNS